MHSSPAWIPGHHHTGTFSAASCGCPVVTMETKLSPRKAGTRPPRALEAQKNVFPRDNCKVSVFSLYHPVFSSCSCVHLYPPLPRLIGEKNENQHPPQIPPRILPDPSQKKGTAIPVRGSDIKARCLAKSTEHSTLCPLQPPLPRWQMCSLTFTS